MHWLKEPDIVTKLRDLAGQENCDGEPYDTMMDAATVIETLRNELRELSDEPRTKTELPGWVQQLWKVCISSSDKDDFNGMIKHIKKLEELLVESDNEELESAKEVIKAAKEFDVNGLNDLLKWLNIIAPGKPLPPIFVSLQNKAIEKMKKHEEKYGTYSKKSD